MFRMALTTVLLSASTLGCASSASAPTAATATPNGVACGDLPAALVQAPSFSEPLRLVHAKPIQEVVGRQTVGAKRGAELDVLATPGYDVTAVRRILACRADVHRAGSSDVDPLAVDGVRVSVRQADHGYVVRLVASDRAGGSDVWSRVSNLDRR